MSAAPEQELLELFARGMDAPLDDPAFNRLALAVFAHQFERNLPYQAFCRGRGAVPEAVGHWMAVPALPTDAFKWADLTTVPPDRVTVRYETSGTTRAGQVRGRHLLPDTRLYDASLLPAFRSFVLPDLDRIRVLVCGPSARHFPHSSLGHMNSRVLERFGAPGSGIFWTGEGPRFSCLAAALEKAAADGEPVCILGTAFGLVHFVDWLAAAGRSFRLPGGSRIMDTGGYKGRSREVPRDELLALYEDRLGVPPARVVNEYGMTELGSQFYDQVLRNAERGRLKAGPPWIRARVVDPETLAPLPDGEVGLLRFFDLANLHTVAAIQTDDLGVMRPGGFEVLGRAAGAEPRGCSLAVEEFLEAGGAR